ncbi:MAG: amylo-alpha-1,6-glucosidase [Candidatus Altiarchaeota archaeon]
MISRERLEEWARFYEKAASHSRPVYMPDAWHYPFFSVNVRDLNIGNALNMEWVLTNGIGGYSSSTILGLDTRRFHGILASSSKNLSRRMMLSGLDEEVSFKENKVRLWMHERKDGVDAPGKDFLGLFKFNLDSVAWVYDLDGVRVEKHIEAIPGRNMVLIEYGIENRFDSDVKLFVKPLVNSRDIGGLLEGDSGFKPKIFEGHAAGISSEGGYLLLYSEKMECVESASRWLYGVKYGLESEVDSTESLFTPVVFTVDVKPRSSCEVSLIALGYGTEEEAVRVFRELAFSRGRERRHKILSSGIGEDLIALSAACDSFIVDSMGRKTVIAGYPSLGQNGREVVMSIPGFTLVSRRFELAEKILDHFLSHMKKGGIPSGFVPQTNGIPEYEDFDSTLWLIDSLNEYRKCVDGERFRRFVWDYWHQLKEAFMSYQDFERNGLLVNVAGTWMRPLERKGAVEVQGLWYNALKIMQDFSVIFKDGINFSRHIRKFEENFMKTYWNGSYLNDAMGDGSLRPNQLVVLSLGYNTVGISEAREILNITEKELLTPVGLRTLSKEDKRYTGRCSGNLLTRDESYYNGAVWPWLAGLYYRSLIKLDSTGGRKEARSFIDLFLKKHLREAGIGTISEVFDGDYPHTPRGCISHALNSAELMRLYSEATKI